MHDQSETDVSASGDPHLTADRTLVLLAVRRLITLSTPRPERSPHVVAKKLPHPVRRERRMLIVPAQLEKRYRFDKTGGERDAGKFRASIRSLMLIKCES